MAQLPKKKEKDAKLSAMLQPYRFLVADGSSSAKSIRLFLSKLLIKPGQIELADNAETADQKIRSKKPEFVFVEREVLEGPGGHQLMNLHRAEIAPGRARAFILITSQNSGVATASAAAEAIDTVVLKPFTFESLMDELSALFFSKINPGPFVRAMDEGRALLEAGEHAKALEFFRNGRDLAETREKALAWYYEGAAYVAMGRQVEAIRSFEEALTHDTKHYRSLSGLLDAHMRAGNHQRAYEIARKIADHFPIPTRLLPEFIRLSIVNKKFDDVVGFFKYTEQADADQATLQHLAAGLVVCGLQYLKDMQAESALDAFRKAEIASRGSPKILKRILCALIAHGLDAELRTFMARAPADIRESPDLRLAELDRVERTSGPERTLAFALRMIKEGLRSERLYTTAIRISVEIGRRQGHIDLLVSEATRIYPEKKQYFENLGAPNAGMAKAGA